MIKHIILWKLKSELSDSEKKAARENAKAALEALTGKIDGLVEIKVEISPTAGSNADMLLYSVFEDEAALNGYQKHPLHVSAADNYVRPFAEVRLCMDFEC